MFDTGKFGRYLATLRKNKDMTQNEVADRLNLTRQAISKYERGDSFPDVSILVEIASLFSVSLDDLIGSGNPSVGESHILKSAALGNADSIIVENMQDILHVAEHLKPSVVSVIAENFAKRGIQIDHIVELSEFLNSETLIDLLSQSNEKEISDELIIRLLPWMDIQAHYTIFQKILDGEMSCKFLKYLVGSGVIPVSYIEFAVVEGAIPWEALSTLREGLSCYENQKNVPIWLQAK